MEEALEDKMLTPFPFSCHRHIMFQVPTIYIQTRSIGRMFSATLLTELVNGQSDMFVRQQWITDTSLEI